MPGILGIIEKTRRPESASTLQRMVDSIIHERSFVSGTVSLAKAGAHLGWVARPGSFSDCLPVWNEARDICLIFSGEVFADESAIALLRQKGHAPDSSCAKYLVHLYEASEVEFLQNLNGSFSGVLVDLRAGKVLLFNDRYGLGRVYFHETRDAFYFASEAKALLKVLPALRQLDMTALGEFFSCGCPLDNRSLFAGVGLLPGAAAWTWQPGHNPDRRTYFDPRDWEKQPTLSPAAFYDRLKEVFTRLVPQYFAGPQAVAMSLTGGLDSRMIMAALRPAPGSLKCYTFGGMYRDCADVKISRAIARTCGLHHEVLTLGPGFFSEFPTLAAEAVRLTDGAMDVTGAANLHLNRLAREIAPVRMTGNFGGEILRGISGLKAHSFDEQLFEPGFVPQLLKVPQKLAAARQASPPAFVAFKQIPWHHYAMWAAESSQLTVRSPYLDNELVALSFQAPPEFRLNKTPAFRYVAEADPRLAGLPNDRGAVWKPGVNLDQPRSRLRYLREEFLPKAEYLFDYGMPDWLARLDRVLSSLHLERLFLGNQKFCHFRLWYRRELSGFVREILLDRRTLDRPFLNRRRVEQIVSSHLAGTANHTVAIHKLLSCELLHRSLIEQN